MSAVTLALLFFLSVALNQQVTEGCMCMQRHLQHHVCSSDVVLRAKVVGVMPSGDPRITAYKIQTIKKFKPLDKKIIPAIYVYETSCGISLTSGEYLLSGHLEDGKVFVNSCDRVEYWNNLSTVKKRYLREYQRSCVCEISPCTGASCLIKKRQKKCQTVIVQQSYYQACLHLRAFYSFAALEREAMEKYFSDSLAAKRLNSRQARWAFFFGRFDFSI